jgi:rare lipoprotein A
MGNRGSRTALTEFVRARFGRAGANRVLRRPLLLAGLCAALGASACSSASVTPPDSAASAPAPDGKTQAPDGKAEQSTSSSRPEARTPRAVPARPVPAPHPYGYLWKAPAGGDPFARQGAPADGAGNASPSQETPGVPPDGGSASELAPAPGRNSAANNGEVTNGTVPEPSMANAPEGAAAGDETGGAVPPNGRAWSPQDLAELAPYLQGIASWYGPNFHGKLTANGETYNQYGLTAAHPVLPIGTHILVENLDNGRRVWLRINDRGPYAKGRILDLSRSAAERLGMIEHGTAPVRITVLKWPDSVQASFGLKPFQQYTVQTAAYPELDRAEELRERLQARFPELPFFVEPASSGFFAVAAGPFDEEGEAKQVSRKLHRSGLSPIVRRYRN